MPIATDKAWLKGRNKHVTGFCNNVNKPAQCEGTKPTSGGVALPVCEHYLTCPCECHYRIDKMFELGNMERQVVPNPNYVSKKAEFVMPEPVIDPATIVAVTPDGSITPQDPSEPVPVATAAKDAPLATRRTDTGRAARGGLEAQVWDALCHYLGIGATQGEVELGQPLTPKLLGEWIAEKYKIPTPSSGAINAVWDRWERLGFAEQAKKPNRFVKFTGSGSWEELVKLKSVNKRQEKQAKTRTMQGYR